MSNFLSGWPAFALGSAFFAGLVVLFGKLGVQGIPSNLATFIRTLVIAPMLLGFVAARREWVPLENLWGRSLVFLVLSAIATGLSWACYYRALQLGPASRVAPADKLSVVFAITFGVAILGEPLSWPVVVGGLLIVSGTLVMLLA